MGRGNDQPLFPSSLFEYENRPARDVAFGYIYVLSLVASIVGGIVAYSNRNADYNKLTNSDHMMKPHSCPATSGRRLLSERPTSDEFNFSEFMMMAGIWIAVSFVGATILGYLFLSLLKKRAFTMIRITVAIQIALPVAAGIASIAAGSLYPGLVMLLFAALTALCFWMWRDQLPLVAKLISVSAQGLNSNPAIIWLIVLLQMGLVAINIPILFSMFVAYMNGDLVYNPERVGSSSQCTDASGASVPCCVWQPDGWVFPYIALAAVTMSWSTFLAFEIKVFMTSGTIAQWYFAPVSVQNFRGNAMRSLKHAFGPSFGSLCMGSGLLTICDIMRNASRNARRENRGSIVACMIACLADCLASLIEYITKFATIRASITGEAFFAAGKNVVGLLTRNSLSTVGVWWLPPTILNTCAFTLSLTWSLLIGLVSFASWRDRHQAMTSAVILAIIAFTFSFAILAFFVSVLLNVIDTVYICFVMDREQQTYTKPEIHEVMVMVPCIGPLIENPGGEVQYGAVGATGGAPYLPPHPPTAHLNMV